MKTLQLTLFLLFFGTASVISQSFTVPQQYTLKTEADYDKHENDIIQCADWLMKTPLTSQAAKRKKATKFLIDYVTGSTRISVDINLKAAPFLNNPELLSIYIASWSRSCLTQNYVNNKEEFTLRAAHDALNFYTKNKSSVGKAKKISKYLTLQSQGKLDDYIKNKL